MANLQVNLKIHYETEFGDELYLVGSIAELGYWFVD